MRAGTPNTPDGQNREVRLRWCSDRGSDPGYRCRTSGMRLGSCCGPDADSKKSSALRHGSRQSVGMSFGQSSVGGSGEGGGVGGAGSLHVELDPGRTTMPSSPATCFRPLVEHLKLQHWSVFAFHDVATCE
jgi:hypothetical protein